MSPFRRALWVLLVLSAAGAFFVQPRVVSAVRAETLAAWWLVVAPAAFSLVVVVAALDTWRTARRTGFFRGPSVLLIAASVAFLGLLLPSTLSEFRARTSPPAETARWEALARHKDPRVRALVMDAVGWRPGPPQETAALLAGGLDDKDPLVQQAALHAVAHKAGEPVEDFGIERARTVVEGWRR